MKKKGYVYLICDNKDNMFKIGKTTKTIEKRIKELQTGNYNEIFITNYHKTLYPTMIENMLHKHFANKQVLNEWYSLSLEDVTNFNSICEKLEQRIEILKQNPFFIKMLK